MASVAFTIIGGAIGSAIAPGVGTYSGAAIGAAIGGAFGGVIDTMWLFPAVLGTGQRDLRGSRLDDISFQQASEGSPAKRCLGPLNRFAGTIIWLPDTLQEVQTSTRVGGKSGSSTTSYSYFTDLAVHVCDCPLHPVSNIRKIWANGKLIYEDGVLDPRVESVTIYKGTSTQNPDPLIESYVGVGNQPAHRHECYVVIKKLALADFGNQIPQLHFLVEDQTGARVGTAIENIIQWTDQDVSVVDTTRVAKCLNGYVVTGPQRTDKTLEPIMLAYDLAAQEVDGRYVFFQRLEADVVTVLESDLSAREEGSGSVTRGLKFKDLPGPDLPSQVVVDFADPNVDLQKGSAQDRRYTAPEENVAQFDIPITFTHGQGRLAARRILRTIWSQRQRVELSLPPKYFSIAESDILEVTYQGEEYRIRVTQVDRGYNYLVFVEGEVVDSETLGDDDNTTDELEATIPAAPVLQSPELIIKLLDIPAFVDGDQMIPCVYLAVCPASTSMGWLGAVAYKSVTEDSDYETVSSIGFESVIGTTKTSLPPGSEGVWDEGSVIVELHRGSLDSRTADEVLAGKNLALVGNEIIGFKTATLVGTRTYKLSGLIRGLRDTFRFNASHVVGEDFVFLDDRVSRIVLSSSDVGVSRTFKVVPVGGTLDDATSIELTSTGSSLRQFAPDNVVAVRNGSDDIVVTWERRSRSFFRILANAPAAVMADEEAYEIDFCLPDGTVLRTQESLTPDVTYTAADQTTDGVGPSDPVLVKVYMLSPVGRGNEGTATV